MPTPWIQLAASAVLVMTSGTLMVTVDDALPQVSVTVKRKEVVALSEPTASVSCVPTTALVVRLRHSNVRPGRATGSGRMIQEPSGWRTALTQPVLGTSHPLGRT